MRLAAFADVDQLHITAAADFLAQGAAEAFQGALHAGGNRVFQRFRGAAEDYHARTFIQALESRLEEVAQLDQLFEAGQPAGVEYQRLELWTVLCGPARQIKLAFTGGEQGVGQLVGKGQHGAGQAAFAANQQGTVHRSTAPGHPTLQQQRRGQTERTDQSTT